MIINFHPKEIESKFGVDLINKFNDDKGHDVFHSSDKTADEWKEVVKGGEKLILVAPTYWWGLGHEFDKWAQDVFSPGFAYTYNEKGEKETLLNDRAFEMHLTHGTPTSYSEVMHENIKTRLETGIFGFVGANVNVNFHGIRD